MHTYRCQSDISNGVNNLLQHVNSVKALAAIRVAVHSFLANPMEEKESKSSSGDSKSNVNRGISGFADVSNNNNHNNMNSYWSEQWTEICNSVLGHSLCLWDAFLRPLLLQRAKVGAEMKG